jgi:hypothetical protein
MCEILTPEEKERSDRIGMLVLGGMIVVIVIATALTLITAITTQP